ncbi:MAG: lysophospholipid acyltransferase family protein, partial [Phycisphaerales bacterium]|nr:lysophospholipid acyltransferase family protein [Phycisphaerales bacterium]
LRAAISTHIINALPIWRRKVTPHAMQELRNLLAQRGCGLVMFPEGQRSEDGEPGRFKAGIGMLVAGTPIPVIPAWISGAGGPHSALQKFRGVPRPRKITVRFGPALTFAHTANEREGWDAVIEGVEGAVKGLRPVK